MRDIPPPAMRKNGLSILPQISDNLDLGNPHDLHVKDEAMEKMRKAED